MDYKPCRIVVRKHWSNSVHPLHLVTDKIKWMTRFKEHDSPVIISLCDSRRSSLHNRGLFVVLHMDNCPDVADQMESDVIIDMNKQDNPLVLPVGFMCSDKFVTHYGLSSSLNSLSFIIANTFPIDRVVIAARTDETFDWAKKQGFETGLIVASTCNKSLLLRCNDTFLSPPLPGYGRDPSRVLQKFNDLFVVHCSPVQQGILSVNTSVVVVRAKDNDVIDQHDDICMLHNDEFTVDVTDGVFKLTNGDLGLNSQSKYITSAVYCSESTSRKLNIKSGSYVIVTIATDEFKYYNEEIGRQDDEFITFEAEDTSPKGLYYKPSERTAILLSVPDDRFCSHMTCSIKGNLPKKICSLCVKNIKVSSSSWFNILGDDCRKNTRNNIIKIRECSDDKQPIFARQVHLSLVLSPHYSASGCFDKSLVNIFNEAQILKIGDVTSVMVEGDYDFYEVADAKSYKCKVIYYKVMGFDEDCDKNKCYLVDTKHTSIYQDGTANSFIPSLRFPHELNDKTVPHDVPGLTQHIQQLRDVLSPYLLETSRYGCELLINWKLSIRQLDHPCSVLLSGQPGCGKQTIISQACRICHIHLVVIDCQTLTSDTPGASEAKINDAFRKAVLYAPCCILLSDIDNIGLNRETGQPDNRVCSALCKVIGDLSAESSLPVVVIATTHDKSNVVADIRMQFLHQIEVCSSSEIERFLMTKHASQCLDMSCDVDFKWIAKHTAGFVFGDIWELMRKTVQCTQSTIIEKCAIGSKLTWREEQSLCLAGVTSSNDDVTEALHHMQNDRADAIGVPKIPDVHWEDIGGLDDVKSHILDTIQLPLDHPELLSTGLRRSGVLLYGPPGTGKTLLAKAVASQCSLSFLSVKGPELINMYVGQSEANIRRVFQRARDAAPCVVFFDELDALAPNRGRSGDSGGVMDRVVSQLLAELDGVNAADNSDKQVFIIAASNRPDLIDQALLRPGRLDKLLYVGISSHEIDKIRILQAQTRKLNISPEVSFDEVVKLCPDNMTGADFYALTTEAAMSSVRRRIHELECGVVATTPCLVEHSDFVQAAGNIVPSVNAQQLANYKRVQDEMSR